MPSPTKISALPSTETRSNDQDNLTPAFAAGSSKHHRDGLGFLVRHVHRAFARVLAERLAPSGITPAQWTILRALWQEDGCSQVELAARVRVEKASLTHVLISLERRGLIVRERSEEDRRRWYVRLTDEGRALEPELLPHAAEIDAMATESLSPEQVATLKSLLAVLLKNLG